MGLLINGQVGWRTAAVIGAPAAASTLWTSVYGVWNADTLGTSLDSSIYAAYNGDNVNDTSGNSRNGTNVNNVTFTTGKIGNAFTFNGSNNINLPNSSFDFTGDFSISVWIKIPVNPSGYCGIFSNYNYDNIDNLGHILQLGSDRKVYFGVHSATSGSSNVVSTTVLVLNTWYHITVKRDSVAKRSDLYINGVFEAQATNTNITIGYGTRAIQPTIGAVRINNQGTLSTYGYLNGQVDALTIWNKKLTEAEILSLYNEGTGAEYPFSSQLLPSLKDATPNANNGTRPASTLTGGVPGPSFTTGKIGKAFTFDGINDYISLPDNSLNLTSKFSYSFWIKSSDTTNYGVVVGNVQSTRSPYSTFHGYEISFDLGKYFFFFRSGYGNQYNHYTTNVVNNGNWNHIVVTYDPTNLTTGAKIYVNGTLNIQANTLGLGNPIGYSSPMKACIGARNHSGSPVNFLPNGTSLDALSAWNKELSATEITELYNAGTGKQYPN